MNDQQRRLEPRIFDTDWLVLKGMRGLIARFADEIARPGAVALDFGCGDRPYASLFTSRGCAYLGADMDGDHELRIAPTGRLECGDDIADLVLSFQVLEHVRDLGVYFEEARRTLRPGGRLLLSTHGTWLYHPHPEDHRRWTRTGLIAEIERHGFRVEASEPVVGPLAWTTMIRMTSFCYVLRSIPIVGRAMAAAVAAFMNLRAALEDRITPKSVTRDNACVYVVLAQRADPPC